MLSSLIKNKKVIISVILSCIFPLVYTKYGINAVLIPFLGTLVLLKIPILPSFIISVAISLLNGDVMLAVNTLVTILLFALLKSYHTDETYKSVFVKFIISNIVSLVLLFITELAKFENFSLLLLMVTLEMIFFVVFKTGLNMLTEIDIIKVCNNDELMALLCVVICICACANGISFSGMTLASLATTLCIMLASIKKPVMYSVGNSLVLTIILGLFFKINIAYFLLNIICGVIISLLSKIGKRGILIGFVFSCAMLLMIMQKEVGIPVENRIQEDYNNFLAGRSGEYGIPNNKILTNTELKQYSISNTITKQMTIGYTLLMLIPAGFYESYGTRLKDYQEIQNFKEKFFNKRFNYELKAGDTKKKTRKNS